MDINEELRKIEELKRYNNRIYSNIEKSVKKQARLEKPGRIKYFLAYAIGAITIGGIGFMAGQMPARAYKGIAAVSQQTDKPKTGPEILAEVAKAVEFPAENQVKETYKEKPAEVQAQNQVKETYNEKPVEIPEQVPKIEPAEPEFYYFPIRGDTLSGIARKVCNDSASYQDIMRYNGIESHIIEVNQPIRIPKDIALNTDHLFHGVLDARFAYAGKGEDLENIAQRVYGDSSRSGEIAAFNRRFNPRFSNKVWNREYILLPGR